MSDAVPVRAHSHASKKKTTNIYRSSTTGGHGQVINHSHFPAVVQNKTLKTTTDVHKPIYTTLSSLEVTACLFSDKMCHEKRNIPKFKKHRT
jgi:hypothetical protein